jgi:hypothetical protein
MGKTMDSAGFEPAASFLRTEGALPLSKPPATFGRPFTREEEVGKTDDGLGGI